MIDELILGDRIDPRREGVAGIVAGPAGVDGYQRLLHQVITFSVRATKPARKEAAQQPGEFRQKRGVSGRVAR